MTKAYICHYGKKGMHWGVRHDRRKQSVTKRRNTQKKNAAKKKSIKERAKEKIAKVDKQKVKNIAKSAAIVAGKIAIGSSLGYLGYITVNSIDSQLNQLRSSTKDLEKSVYKDYSDQINETRLLMPSDNDKNYYNYYKNFIKKRKQ